MLLRRFMKYITDQNWFAVDRFCLVCNQATLHYTVIVILK
mgnify:CR=1 FL=1|jgi:hypothetical protein